MNRLHFSPPVAAALAAALLFGASTPFAKQLLRDLSPVLLAGLLYLGSGIGLGLIRLARDRGWRKPVMPAREWLWLLLATGFGGVLAPLALMLGLMTTPAATASLLLNLEGMQPAVQVRHWHGVCLLDGLNPWRVLYLPAPQWGDDCTRCTHLTTREDVIDSDRRRYHWACRHGYLILEHGRGTERVYVAPPECHSFDRWYPSQQR